MAKTVIILGSRREGNGQYLANKIKDSQKELLVILLFPVIKKYIFVLDVWIVILKGYVILKMT